MVPRQIGKGGDVVVSGQKLVSKRPIWLAEGGGALTGAGYGEKSSKRLVQRNGYRDRDRARRPRPIGT